MSASSGDGNSAVCGGFLLDTNVCIEFVKGNLPIGYKVMQASDPRLFKISSVVLAELYTGMAKSKLKREKRARTQACLLKFVEPFEILPFDSKCAAQYATIRAALEKRGAKIGPNDLMIAATAMANGCVLVTGNVGEFERVEGLRIENWAEVAL